MGKSKPKKKIYDDTSKVDGYDKLSADDKKKVEDEMKALSSGNSAMETEILNNEKEIRKIISTDALAEIDTLGDEDKVALYLTLLGCPPDQMDDVAKDYKKYTTARDK